MFKAIIVASLLFFTQSSIAAADSWNVDIHFRKIICIHSNRVYIKAVEGPSNLLKRLRPESSYKFIGKSKRLGNGTQNDRSSGGGSGRKELNEVFDLPRKKVDKQIQLKQ